MDIPPIKGFCCFLCLATVFFSHVRSASGETAEQAGAASAQDAAKRLQWLKSVQPAAAAPSPSPAPALVKKRFSETRNLGVRFNDSLSVETNPAGKGSDGNATPAGAAKESRVAAGHRMETPAKVSASPAPKLAETHSTTHSTAVSKSADQTEAAARHDENVASGKRTAESHVADTPSPKKSTSETTHPENIASKRSTDPRIAETHPAATPSKSTPAPARSDKVASTKRTADLRIADIHPAETPSPKPTSYATRGATVSSRYPWKTAIVTTVFWIGEPVGGNNFTPNCSSSWDAHWTQSYGGFDNPKPEARRNFLPVNFTPRQNPFYVALPYNDVTRGTTKPEARVVIPWFKEAFRKEGQSVCRDRWVQIRSRGGRVVYAQWSDCGPFRTDHWQYVFGMERPKANLNAGAGLDVSPAVRDYLGLQSTDVTDWKFVDAHEVPNGPWLLYGDNNPFSPRRASVAKANGPVLAEVAANRR